MLRITTHERIAVVVLLGGVVGAVVVSCGDDVEAPSSSATVAATASSSASKGVGGAGGGGGSSTNGKGGAGGCMVAVGGCYDAFECTPWAACECPELPCGADCTAYRDCVSACTSNACIDGCRTAHPAGASEQSAILVCAHCGADPCLGSLCDRVYPPVQCP